MAPTVEEEMYRFLPQPTADFFCGEMADGGSFLLGQKDNNSACLLFFDQAGRYVKMEIHSLSLPVDHLHHDADTQCKHEALAIQELVDKLVRNNGGHVAPILIRTFYTDEATIDIGVYQLPWVYQKLIDNPNKEREELGDDEFLRLQEELRQWIERGDYVFIWGNEHEMNKDGKIVAS